MSQENAEISAKFSTLNVNAMEFVPSFCQERTSVVTTDLMEENRPENNGRCQRWYLGILGLYFGVERGGCTNKIGLESL